MNGAIRSDGRLPGAPRIASCQQRNRASIRLAERCGLRRTHETHERVHFSIDLDGAFVDPA